jgi:pyruvate formate lyase activating enzyme
MTTAKIFGLSRHRLTTDGEGVTTLVTFNGCPLRCKYCINKTSWEMSKGRDYTPEALYEEVKIDQLYFLATHGGITFGGGEPLLQKDFIKEFRALCGPQWSLVVETSLHVPFDTVQEMNDVLDGYIVDIKDMNPEIYLAYTGKELNLALKNLEWILQYNDAERVMVRVPHIPEYNTEEDVAKTVERLREMGVEKIDEFEYIIR